jgi:two-component system cell cycle response regulator
VGARILLIEDNPTNQELMTYLLTAFGHNVLAVENGQQGLEKISLERPDPIICDARLRTRRQADCGNNSDC